MRQALHYLTKTHRLLARCACAVWLLLLVVSAGGCADPGSSTTKIYKAPFSRIKDDLARYLNFGPRFSEVEGGLAYKDIKYGELSHYLARRRGIIGDEKNKWYKPDFEVTEYDPGRKLVIVRVNYYNIWSSGSRGLSIEVRKKTTDLTSVTVDYFDNEYVMFIIPIVQSSKNEEQYIHHLFFEDHEVVGSTSGAG